jgi:predicted regulator of Ras-like GTPase activity (Roadblock/LC7/MglB family)
MEPEVVDLTTIQVFEKIFNDLQNVGGIEALAIASRDGLLICSNMPQKQNAETFAAMAATMLGAAETATAELGKGIPGRIIVESKHGKIIATGAGPKALLLVMTETNASLGLILVEIVKASERIKQVLD